MTRPLILFAVGDVAVERETPGSMFVNVQAKLTQGDFVFGQLETPISDRGSPSPHPTLAVRSSPKTLAAIRASGFNVMSFAGNHCLDWGYEAFFDTLQHLRGVDISACGAGSNLQIARVPAVLEREGVKLAVLAYSSILPAGYWAEKTRPGCVPMRAHTHYEQLELDQPGTPPKIRTFAHDGDLAALVADVRLAKQHADIVAVSMHWGIHFIEGQIADYQREVAYAEIEAGADVILGHHPHILKGVEVHKGKAIFYSMGNSAIEQPSTWNADLKSTHAYKTIHELNPTWDMNRAYTLPYETRRTMVVRCEITQGKIARVSYLPAFIADDSSPSILDPDDPKFHEVATYVENLTRSHHLAAAFTRKANEIEVTAS